MTLEDPVPVPVALELEENEMAEEEEEDEEEEYGSWSSESEVVDALDWLDSKKGVSESIYGTSFSFSVARHPNAHNSLLSRVFQPLSNHSQKFASHIRADPLEEWEGRLDVGLSNSVTTAILDSVQELAIGRTKNTDKADRATVEQLKGTRGGRCRSKLHEPKNFLPSIGRTPLLDEKPKISSW